MTSDRTVLLKDVFGWLYSLALAFIRVPLKTEFWFLSSLVITGHAYLSLNPTITNPVPGDPPGLLVYAAFLGMFVVCYMYYGKDSVKIRNSLPIGKVGRVVCSRKNDYMDGPHWDLWVDIDGKNRFYSFPEGCVGFEREHASEDIHLISGTNLPSPVRGVYKVHLS